MEAHNCEHAGVHVPYTKSSCDSAISARNTCENGHRSLPLGNPIPRRTVRGSWIVSPSPNYISELCVLDGEIGADRRSENHPEPRNPMGPRSLETPKKNALKQDSAFIPVGKHAENFRNYRAGQTRDNCRIWTLSNNRQCPYSAIIVNLNREFNAY